MVTMEKLQRGLASFLDRELVPKLSGWDKVLVGGGAGLAVAKLPNLLAQYPVLNTLGIYDMENNQVDIDALYQAVATYIGSETLPVTLPMVKLTVKIGRQEVDALYRYIKEA